MTPSALRIRPATTADIAPMHRIRLAVSENKLTNPARISEQSYAPYIAAGGAWVAEIDGDIRGFAIVDAVERSVWALFVDPGAEGKGIGRALHDQMIGWARDQKLKRLTLVTAPGTRATHFYRALGWVESGFAANGDTQFVRDV